MKRLLSIPKDELGDDGGWCPRGWVNVTLYGKNEKELKAKALGYYREFDPRGYGTHTMTAPFKTKQGYWETRIRRWSTCD